MYLPDMKYALEEPARQLSGAGDYPTAASGRHPGDVPPDGALGNTGGPAGPGVLIRHLVLPGQLGNTRRVIDWVAETFRPGRCCFP